MAAHDPKGKAGQKAQPTPLSISEKSIFRISWPVLFELLMLYMIPAVDTYYLSRLSTQAVASVSAILPLTALGMILFIPLTQAGTSVAAQHLGARSSQKASLAFSLMILLNLALGLGISLIFFSLADILPQLMGLDPSMATMAASYISMLGTAYIFLALKVGVSGILNASGHTLINMLSALIMNAMNLALNHIFVTGAFGFPKLGVSGIALATALAYASAFLFGLYFCYRQLASLRTLRESSSERRIILSQILRIGVPSTLEPLSYQVSQVVITKILVQLGPLALTTKAYVGNITHFALLWSAAFAAGTQIKTAHLIGAQAYQEASAQVMSGVRIVLLGCTVISVSLALGARPLLGLFTSDPAALALGSTILWVAIALEWGRALNVLVGSVLRASGDAQFVALFGLLSMWIVAVGGAYLGSISWGWGLLGIWLAMIADEHLRGWATLARWRSGVWRRKVIYR